MQRLIMPVNNSIVSASYKNQNYFKKFGFEHWGVDMYGSLNIYAQGYGVVINAGSDTLYGNFVQVLYLDCESSETGYLGHVVANYFHLNSVLVKTGQRTTKDTKLGLMGKTGKYATGVHLHLEMRIYVYEKFLNLSPFGSENFIEDSTAFWFNPLSISHVKKSAPDSQTMFFSDETYTNILDRKGVLYYE